MDAFSVMKNIRNNQLSEIDFKSDAEVARKSKEWKQNRDEILDGIESCEWCERETENLHIHHTWGKSFNRQWMKSADEAFIDSDAYSKRLTKDRQECPGCKRRNYYKRKTKSPDYRCKNCGDCFDSPKVRDGGYAIKTEKYDNKPYTTGEYHKEKARWVKNNQDIVMSFFRKRYKSLLDEYKSLRQDQVVPICEKCHYKEERTDKKLCKECEKNWYDSNYGDEMCWDCIVDSKGLKECSSCGENWYNPSYNEKCQSCR